MLKRTITAVVALAVFFAVLYAGAVPFQIAIGAVILIMLHEAYSAVTPSKAVKTCGLICGIILMAGIYFKLTAAAVVTDISLIMIFLVFLHGSVNYRELFAASLITFYITLFTGCISLLRSQFGIALMAFVFIIAWGSDTAAYFCGTFFGRHKLIPRVSPKKTIEGSGGAIAAAALLCVLYQFIMYKSGHSLGGVTPTAAEYIKTAVLGAFCSASSQMGDLAASAIKRDAGIKDYGRIFPGHGGFMDRFDSVIFIAPIVYGYMCITMTNIP